MSCYRIGAVLQAEQLFRQRMARLEVCLRLQDRDRKRLAANAMHRQVLARIEALKAEIELAGALVKALRPQEAAETRKGPADAGADRKDGEGGKAC